MPKVFIDGEEGTTGLQIHSRLEKRGDIELIHLDDSTRKDETARREALAEADLSFLCLPDDVARDTERLLSDDARVIDCSTAHRTAEGWTYGFPELAGRREKIKGAKRVSNPGCHATGFISLLAPLVEGGILPADERIVAHSLTGYSGGGKKMIRDYEREGRESRCDAPAEYSLELNHKHIPEMMRMTGLSVKPAFNPIVADFYCGMCVTVPIFRDRLKKKMGRREIREYFSQYYAGHKLIEVAEPDETMKYLPSNELAGRDILKIYVLGNDDEIMLSAILDNLGKGAAGAAIQNMNVMLGLDEYLGLRI